MVLFIDNNDLMSFLESVKKEYDVMMTSLSQALIISSSSLSLFFTSASIDLSSAS